MNKEHNYGIDLLRIFLMLMIVAGHMFVHTGIRDELPTNTFSWSFTWISQTIILCAINCFVLITGYFSNVNSYNIRIKKILLLYGQVLLYSASIYVILLAIGKTDFSAKGIIHAFFPFLSGQYWFFSSYILLLLLMPFLNYMLSHINDFALKTLTIIIVLIFYVLPIFRIVFMQFDTAKGMGIIGFITLYIIGHALKRFEFKLSKLKCIIGILLNCAIMFASKVVLNYIVVKFDMDVGSTLLYNYNTIFQLINATLLLMLFKDIKIKIRGAKLISFVSASTFGIYLIHEQPKMRELLWNEHVKELLLSSSGVTYIALSVVIPTMVFLLCLAIDVIRRLIGKAFSKIKLIKNFDVSLIAMERKINERINKKEY